MSENEKIELYILSKEHLLHYVLPQNAQGSLQLYMEEEKQKERILRLRALKQQWYFVSNEQTSFLNNSKAYIAVEKKQHYEVEVHHEQYLLLTSSYDADAHRFFGYRCSKKEWYVGRSEDCDVIYTHHAISFHHARIFQDEKGWHLQDINSRNGCFVNGKRVENADLHIKDRIQILELIILLCEDEFYINHVKDCHFKKTLQLYKRPQKAGKKEAFTRLSTMYLFEEAFEKKVFEIDMPPALSQQDEMPLLLSLGPSFTMGLSSLSMGLFALFQVFVNHGDILQSIPTLMMSFTMAAGSILWPLLSRHYRTKKRTALVLQIQQSYRSYLKEMEAAIYLELHSYEAKQQSTFLSFSQCLLAFKQHQRFVMEKQHPAFLQVMLGYGNYEYSVQFQASRVGYAMEKQELTHERETLVNNGYRVENVPITLSFRQTKLLYLSGKSRKAFLLQLLFLSAMLHLEDTLHILLHMDETMAYESGALYLPHLELSDGERLLVCEKSEEALERKLRKLQHSETAFCVIFDFYDKENVPLYENTSRLQCVGKQEHTISAHCAALHLEEESGNLRNEHTATSFHYTLYEETELRNIAYIFANSQRKANMKQHQQTIHFLDMYHCGSVEELNIQERWKKGIPSRSLCVCIGRKENNEDLLLDLHEHAHGPHGLIAGMTGAGKSECLLTLILSLCVTFSPDKVSFLLIDYKGGTMVSTLRKLPHVAGVITNLETDQLQRAFLSLQSELLKRQQLMSEAALRFDRGNMNIEEYEELCVLHEELPPLPHLMIIVDEFAQLKTQQPAFMEQLKQSARIGRSLGIHLLLATQKPAGVIDDQIWSNAHFHLCMKVQTIQDSQDMLKKKDAAYLKKAGECCLQVGYDEVYEKGVIAWARSPYYRKDMYEEEHFDEVILQSAEGTVLNKRHILKTEKVKQTQMEALIHEICHIAKKQKLQSKPLWKEVLSAWIPVAKYPKTVALIDDVSTQRQFPLMFDEESLIHTFLFGCNDESITMYLTTFLYVATQHINREMLVYILDFAQHELRAFLHHAFIMDVISENEKEKVTSLFVMLKAEMAERKKGKEGPLIVVIVHNYASFHELYSQYEEILQYLLREGAALNMVLYISALSVETLPYRFSQYPHISYVFELQDTAEYRRIFQNAGELQPGKHKGSGLLLEKGIVCLFQTLFTSKEDIARLKGWHDWQRMFVIPMMPKQISHNILDAPLYLGKELLSIKDLSLNLEGKSLVYICAAMHHFETTMMLWKKQLEIKTNVCFVNKDIYYQGKALPLSHFDEIMKKTKIVIWQHPYTCDDTKIQHYLKEELLEDDKTHVFVFTMREQMDYNRYEWFSLGFYGAIMLWMGKGFNEYRHLFHNTELPQKDLKKNQGLLIKEDTWTTLQLWEVEKLG